MAQNIYNPVTKTYTSGTQDVLNNASAQTGAIAVDSLATPVVPVTLPTPTTPTPVTFPTIPTTPAPNPQEDIFKKYLDEQTAPTSQADLYTQAQNEAGIKEKQQTVNDLTAQLNQINAETSANKLSQEGRQASMGAISGQQASLERQGAIRALPISAQLSAAQGNLQSAQSNLETLFKIKSEDATNTYNYQKSLRDSVYQYATDQQKQQLDAQQKADNLKYQTEKDLNTYKQSIVKDLISSGQVNLIPQLTEATTFDEISNIAGKIKPTTSIDDQYKQLQIQKLQKELNSTGSSANAQDLIAYAQDTVSSGKLPSVQELKNAGLSAGMVMQVAKELPKTDGEIVDNNTGIKSGKLSSPQIEGLAALRDLTLKLDQAKSKFSELNTGLIGGTLGNIFPSKARQDYSIIKSEIVDLLSRARSGAALTESEIKTYSDKLPSTFNQTFWLGGSGENLLEGLEKSISDKLNTSLKAQGTSMYGFSKVKLGGQDYTVGQEIEANGIRGRVNPDRTITKI